MTEEVLNAAIQRLSAAALEQYALIKDVYHQPMTGDTVNIICNAASQMAQLEGAMITLQQYSKELSVRTPAELAAAGEEAPEQSDDDIEQSPSEPESVSHDELMARSPTYRRSQENQDSPREDDES